MSTTQAAVPGAQQTVNLRALLEEMIKHGVGETWIRVELYHLAESLAIQIIEIPSRSLLRLGS